MKERLKKLLLKLWKKADGNKTAISMSIAVILQNMVELAIIPETKLITLAIRVFTSFGIGALGHKGVKYRNKLKEKKAKRDTV